MTTRGFQPWRRAAGVAQALAYLGLPFVTIGGESALRLDVPGGRLHALGGVFALGEAFVVLAATLLAVALFLLVTLLYGRVWCGWSCPQTVLGDLTALVVPERRARPRRWRRPVGFALVALVSIVFGAATLWYFVPPREFLARLAGGTLGPVLGWSWVALSAVLFADLAFLRQTFCATVCPYAKLQGVLFDRSTLVIAYDARRAADCVDCGACVRVCPTGIDIRDGLQMECIACAACIDACQPIMKKLRRAPDLVGYVHGEPGGAPRPLRPAVVALALVSLLAAGALAGAVASRAVVSVTARQAVAFAPRRLPDGRVLAAFEVALENHGRAPVEVALAVVPEGGGSVTVRPDHVTLDAGARRSLRLLATGAELAPGRAPARLTTEVRAGAAVVERASTPLSLPVPEAP